MLHFMKGVQPMSETRSTGTDDREQSDVNLMIAPKERGVSNIIILAQQQ
jgi:hypothetical protein